jgi:hypothetical protein
MELRKVLEAGWARATSAEAKKIRAKRGKEDEEYMLRVVPFLRARWLVDAAGRNFLLHEAWIGKYIISTAR